MAQIEYQLTGSYMPGFGANPYLFLDGHFLFGWLGVIYCFFVGVSIAYARSLSKNILVFFIAVKFTTYFVTDPAIAQAQFISLLVYLPFLIPLYIFVKSTNAKFNLNLKKFHLRKKATFEKV
jgi:hypothetical protein